jgi:hypothetical protein
MFEPVFNLILQIHRVFKDDPSFFLAVFPFAYFFLAFNVNKNAFSILFPIRPAS